MKSEGIPAGWGYTIGGMPKEKPRNPIPFEEVVGRLLAYKPEEKARKPMKRKEKKK